MGPLYHPERVSDSVFRTPSSVRGPDFLQPVERLSSGRRGRQSPFEGCSGENRPGKSRVLFSDFHRSEKERKVPTHNRSVSTKQVRLRSELPDGNSEESKECHLSERLGIFIGPYRCVSACSDPQAVTQVPSILSERSDLPVQGFSIRALDQPFRLYLPHECNCYISQEKSDHSASLSRRLVSQKPMSSNSVGTQTLSNVFDNFSRVDYQLREVRARSNTDFHIHRDGILDQSQSCQSSSGQNSKNTPSHSGLFSGDIRISQDFPVSFGTTQCGSRSRCFGQTPSQTITNVPVVTMETSYTSIGPTNSSHSGCIISPQLVETRTDLPPRRASESSSGLSHDLHGRQHGRLGISRGTGGSVVSWCLDQRPIPSPHQHAGDAGNSSHSGSCLPCHNGLHGSGFNRQYHSSGISVSPGRHSFSRSQQRDLEDSNLVPTEQDPLTCEAYSRQVQHPGRPAKPGEQTYFDRVGSEPGNSQSSFFHDRVSKHRLIRNSSESQASSVCFPNSRPEGTFNRCSINELEQSSCLCISTVPSHLSCDKQSEAITVQSSSGSPILAQQVLVSRTSESVGVRPNQSSSLAKPARTVKRKVLASKHRCSATSRLDFVKQSIRDKRFSKQVAEHVVKARRESTRKVYDAKWRVYLDWANKRQIDPIKATPNVIADFLTFLFNEKKCQVSTIRGYRSMISNTLKFSAGFDIGSHPVLSDLITSFQLQRPISRSLAPKWDLAFVLSHICKAPFEPLSQCSLFHLSLKSAFLIAMATAKRVSEIHAFSIDKDHFRFSHIDGSLTLRTQPGFLAKNQLPSKAPDSIRIPKLSNHCRSSDFNRKLCPIRAIKAYIDRTKSIRNGRTRLFIPTKGNHDLKKSTISSWIKYTISHAYKSLSKHQIKLLKVKAHELRALSTSWAYTSSIPLEEVIKAAVWSNSSTFASFYLRNMGSQAENLRQMGPIVAAQRMVGGARQSGPPDEDA